MPIFCQFSDAVIERATLLTLFVLPALYALFGRKRLEAVVQLDLTRRAAE